jgi:hypothetical protein
MLRGQRLKLTRMTARIFLAMAQPILVALSFLSLMGLALAQPQLQSPPQSQLNSQQAQPSPTAVKPKPKTDKDNVAGKVYTDEDVERLPANGVSVVGPATPPQDTTGTNGEAPARAALANESEKTAKAEAYWKARFAAARNKLAQDQKALLALQSQLETERVQQDLLVGDTTQVYSDEFMDLLHRVGAMKLEIQNDKRALSDLHEQFRKAGGLPGWIR